jgi:hypothetical protein
MQPDGTVFGWPLRFTDSHIDTEVLEELRHKFDDVGDNCFLALMERNEKIDDFISTLADSGVHSSDKRIQAFVEQVCSVPDWVDFEKLNRGQDVFIRNSSFAAMALLYFSLIGGFAAPKITKVLEATSYLTKTCGATWRRLNETFEMIVDCIDDAKALRVGDRGWKSVLRVRFLHSRVRLRLLGKIPGFQALSHGTTDHAPQYDSTHATSEQIRCPVFSHSKAQPSDDAPGEYARPDQGGEIGCTMPKSGSDRDSGSGSTSDWDIKEYGIPINQEDMMATLCSFSANVLDVINRMSIVPLSLEEEEAYLHLWRYIGQFF